MSTLFSYTLELSNPTFNQIYETVHYFMNVLKTNISLEEVTRAYYGLNITLKMLKCHLEAFAMMFEKRDQWPIDKELSKYEGMTEEEVHTIIEQQVEKIEIEKRERKGKRKRERKG